MSADYRQGAMAPHSSPPGGDWATTYTPCNADMLRRERAAADAAQQLAAYQAAELEKLRNELALARLDAEHHPAELRKLRDQVTGLNRSLTAEWERARHAEAWAVAAMTRAAELEREVSALKIQLARRREAVGIIAGEVSAIAELVREVSPAYKEEMK